MLNFFLQIWQENCFISDLSGLDSSGVSGSLDEATISALIFNDALLKTNKTTTV